MTEDEAEPAAQAGTIRPKTRRRRRASAAGPRLERIVGILTGVGIIVFVMALIWRGEPIADPNLATMARIVLALGIGAVGATIPGFLNVDYSARGLVIRGAGGLAVFLIAFFGTPKIQALHLTSGELTLPSLEEVEFRAADAPQTLRELRMDSATLVTLDLKATNASDQMGRPVQITRTAMVVTATGAPERGYDWKYFGRHVSGDDQAGGMPGDRLFAGRSDAAPIALAPATSVSQAILHYPVSGDSAATAWHWQSALDAALESKIRSVRVTVQTAENGTFETECIIDAERARQAVTDFVTRNGVLPRYFRAFCQGRREWTQRRGT
ncbi:MAG TPA: hypothetical protein VMG08_11890 [Allosphingosinicella sp.]|nr:hypothetical protein [Allosphingosinicella sp.]